MCDPCKFEIGRIALNHHRHIAVYFIDKLSLGQN